MCELIWDQLGKVLKKAGFGENTPRRVGWGRCFIRALCVLAGVGPVPVPSCAQNSSLITHPTFALPERLPQEHGVRRGDVDGLSEFLTPWVGSITSLSQQSCTCVD